MKRSNPISLVARLQLRVWWRRLTGVFAGRPHIIALTLPFIVLYGFFAWQIKHLIQQLTSLGVGSDLTVLLAGLSFGITVASTWFLARQAIETKVPGSLIALPIVRRDWLLAQAGLFIGAVWILNSLVALPLFVALGQQEGLPLGWWLLFSEVAFLFYVACGMILFLATERIMPPRLAILHTFGQVGVVVAVGYRRLFHGGSSDQLNIGLEAKYFIQGAADGTADLLLVFVVGAMALSVLAWVIYRLCLGFRASGRIRSAAQPFSARLLHMPANKIGAWGVAVWRIILSDKETSLPNFVIIGSVFVAAIAVRLDWLAGTVGMTLYAVYNFLFILLFASWALNVRGRLGASRRVVYVFPVTTRQLVSRLFTATMVAIVGFYVVVEILLFWLLGGGVGESWSNIAKNTVILTGITALTFLLGHVGFAGQKNKLSQVPIAVGFAITSILSFALFAWVSGRYSLPGLVLAACACVAASVVVARTYEEGHVLDEA